MKTLRNITGMKGKRALVRVDFNVPIQGNTIRDAQRIKASFATIQALQKKGIEVSLIAHRGEKDDSLTPVATYLAKHFKVVFITEPIRNTKRIHELVAMVPKGVVVLFENIRAYEGEEKNSASFAKALSQLGDIFVNDAFSVSHRKHASVVGVTRYLPSYAGIQFEKELKHLSPLLTNKKHPFLFILGGAKFSTKIPLLKRFIGSADQVCITGAIANSFYKAVGFEIGISVTEEGYDTEIKKLLTSPTLLLPVDVVVLRGEKKISLLLTEVQPQDCIVDIGPQSVALVKEKVMKAKVIVWNGPTGWYEKGFIKATVQIAKAMVEGGAVGVVGGGDTGAVVEKYIGENTTVFVSTGGGATLQYLSSGSLPGIDVLVD